MNKVSGSSWPGRKEGEPYLVDQPGAHGHIHGPILARTVMADTFSDTCFKKSQLAHEALEARPDSCCMYQINAKYHVELGEEHACQAVAFLWRLIFW